MITQLNQRIFVTQFLFFRGAEAVPGVISAASDMRYLRRVSLLKQQTEWNLILLLIDKYHCVRIFTAVEHSYSNA